jgi:uncharacterized protein (DUF1778 family)
MGKKTGHSETGSRSRPKKDVPFNIRVTADEKEAFDQAAELAGTAVSAWVRERLRRAARRELEEDNRAIPFLKSRI